MICREVYTNNTVRKQTLLDRFCTESRATVWRNHTICIATDPFRGAYKRHTINFMCRSRASLKFRVMAVRSGYADYRYYLRDKTCTAIPYTLLKNNNYCGCGENAILNRILPMIKCMR